MPGSLSQPIRGNPRFGANVIPIAGQGYVRVAPLTGGEYQSGMRVVSPSLGGLGIFGGVTVLFKAPTFTGSFTISGVTRDSNGVPLAACSVDLFKTDAFDTWIAQTTSDGSGNYSFTLGSNSGYFWLRAYKPGSPDVAGTTLNTITAA